MLRRTFPLMSRRCNQLTRVAFAGIAFTVVSPLRLIASDEGKAGDIGAEKQQGESLAPTESNSGKSELGENDEGKANEPVVDKQEKASQRKEKRGSVRQGKSEIQAKAKSRNGEKADRTKVERHAHGETPALGVLVSSCPGNAVCVKGVIAGSPADDAGLQEGDYILAVNEEQVASPEQLRQVVDRMQAKENVKIRLWREGTEQTEEVTLASKAELPPESHRAWLGVMLTVYDDEGLAVGRDLPGSPAFEAGLQEDDVIRKLNDKQVKDLPSFLECIEDMGPGAKVSIVVDRDGNEQTINAQLGDIEDAPLAFLREAMRHTAEEPEHTTWGSDQLPPLMEETLDEMRNRIRKLEKQVKEMQTGSDEVDSGNALIPSVLQHEALAQEIDRGDGAQETLIVQRGRDRSYGRGNAYVPGYRGNHYYNRTPYRSGYRYGYPPIYRSPGSGNSYYRYGGRPYYYGNYGRSYGYGIRSGIQIGRNFGVYW